MQDRFSDDETWSYKAILNCMLQRSMGSLFNLESNNPYISSNLATLAFGTNVRIQALVQTTTTTKKKVC